MRNTTLIYIERDDKYLMLHRVKKENDLNRDKWIGVGGKFFEDESPDECAIREVREETGLTMTSYRLRGIVTFVSDIWENETMFLYTCSDYSGVMNDDCREGVLEWIDKRDIYGLPLWEGDKIFLRLIEDKGSPFFTLKLVYEGERLVSHTLF